MLRYFLFLIVLFFNVEGVRASDEIKPSFDCAKAKTEVEKLICSDVELAKLDAEMNQKYKKMYQQMKEENPQEIGKFMEGYPEVMVKAQKRWLERRNKVKDIPSLKKSYEEGIARIDSYLYLKGCYKSTDDFFDSKFRKVLGNYNSVIDLYICEMARRSQHSYSGLITIYDKKNRTERILKDLNEREELKKEIEKMFSEEELKNVEERFKTNHSETSKELYEKIGRKLFKLYEVKERDLKKEVDLYFSNACEFYNFACSQYGFLCSGLDSVKYKMPDGEYRLVSYGFSSSCQYFYYFERERNDKNGKEVTVPTKPDACYQTEALMSYKNNSYVKLPANAVYEDLSGAKYALYRFDPDTLSFVYDCVIKQ